MSNRALTLASSRPLTVAEADFTAGAMTAQQVIGQVALIQQIMEAAMKDGHHFGKIPGCGDKPALLKPGAEKLCLTFRLAASYEVKEDKSERGHREYQVTCTLTSILHGNVVGAGLGSCSTLESKYRYRGNEVEVTDRAVPRAFWDAKNAGETKRMQELLGGPEFSPKKIDGQWMIVKKKAEKMENPDLADQYNTVLKMAKKRALVDAVLTATAASDIFAQDLEDLAQNMEASATHRAQERPPEQPVQEVGVVDDVDDAPAADFRQQRIHFGKNRGLELSELTPQQIHWYETDWMPKKEAGGVVSQQDRVLINALHKYREWRTAEKAKGAAEANGAVNDYPADAPDADPEFTTATP